MIHLLFVAPIIPASLRLFQKFKEDCSEEGDDDPECSGNIDTQLVPSSDCSSSSSSSSPLPSSPSSSLFTNVHTSSRCDELSHVQMKNVLGPKVDLDEDEINYDGFIENNVEWKKPENLEHVLEIDLPAGYFRIRRALLCSKNEFWDEIVLSKTLKYSKIISSEWDKHNDVIGLPNLPSHIGANDIVGTTKTTEYLMPKSPMVRENMAHETTTITEYNNRCFAIEMKTTNPDIPYGNQFIAHTKIIVYNKGCNTCQMVCSVEAIFPNGPPRGVGWQIKKSMKNGSMATFEKIGSSIQECAIHHDDNEEEEAEISGCY